MAAIFDLTGRVALVTGAGQSVGAGIAGTLAAQGAAVAVNDIVAERALTVAGRINRAGGRAIAAVFDVTDPDAVAHGVEAARAELGPIDILVNNAGNAGAHAFVPKPFIAMEPAEYARFIDVNLYGVLHCSRSVLPGMIDRGWGRVITIASGAGTHGNRMGISIYGAAKGAAIAFMRHLALEVARNGITANTVALGLMANVEGGSYTAELAKSVPAGRLGQPADAAAACAWLASNEGAWMTGKTISLDGGSTTS